MSSYNKETNKESGLTEEFIITIRNANGIETFDGMPTVMDTINNLLSDKEFYEFIDEFSFKINAVRSATEMKPESKQGHGNLDIEDYRI